jgi:hypothetical protein
MFINLSNHPSEMWDEQQRAKAQEYGRIEDMAFPDVPAQCSAIELDAMADRIAHQVLEKQPDCVMCQGEFTLTYRVITRLKGKGVIVVAACSERKCEEQVLGDGTVRKVSKFQFRQFRRY